MKRSLTASVPSWLPPPGKLPAFGVSHETSSSMALTKPSMSPSPSLSSASRTIRGRPSTSLASLPRPNRPLALSTTSPTLSVTPVSDISPPLVAYDFGYPCSANGTGMYAGPPLAGRAAQGGRDESGDDHRRAGARGRGDRAWGRARGRASGLHAGVHDDDVLLPGRRRAAARLRRVRQRRRSAPPGRIASARPAD